MRSRQLALALAVAAVLASASATLSAQQPAAAGTATATAATGTAGSTLTIEGQVKQTLTLSVDDLRKLPAQTVVRHPEHPHKGADGQPQDDRYTGCLLRDILNQAGLTEPHRRDLRRSYILITATDGYQTLFSWGEIFNSEMGDAIFVAYERNSEPINDPEGRIAVLSLKDTTPGPRFARGVSSIQVLRAEGVPEGGAGAPRSGPH